MESLATLFKALSDETRLRIVHLLGAGELCVCDLMHVLDLPQSRISRHLAYLKSAGWIRATRCGKWMHYALNRELPPLESGLLEQLALTLAAHPQGLRDRAALQSYLETKDPGHCG